jgi:cytochrome c oxidase assembly factor CtaG
VGATEPTVGAFLLAWSGRADVVLVLAALGIAYMTGWHRLRRRQPRAVTGWMLAAYLGGLAAVALALLSPIDTFGGWLFTLHMLQHQLLAMIAAPLLLLGNPVPVALWALPRQPRRALGAALARGRPLGRLVRVVTWMPLAWSTYMVVLVGWHLPPAFEAALADPRVHDAQHWSFFLAGLLFWWPVVSPAPRLRGHVSYGLRIVYVLAGLLVPMVPVMSMVLVDRLLYRHYASVPRLWGLTPLQDQQTGWVTMAVIDNLVYGIAFFALLSRAFRREEREEGARQGLPAGAGPFEP